MSQTHTSSSRHWLQRARPVYGFLAHPLETLGPLGQFALAWTLGMALLVWLVWGAL